MINSFLKKPKVVKEDRNFSIFEIEGLYAGYGLTLGNALRRTLLSSLKGSAITKIKVKGVSHEFSTMSGIAEDMVQIILNIKKIRVKNMEEGESQTLFLSVKGEKEVKAKDIDKNANVEILNPDAHIATLTDKKSELEISFTVESGRGYEPVQIRKKEKLPVGTISLDALFSPIKNVNCEVEDMRVGDKTNYNRLRVSIETDGSISPKDALKESANILISHFKVIAFDDENVEEDTKEESKVEKEEKPKKSTKKK